MSLLDIGMPKYDVAEFFAGVGLVRRALEATGRFRVVFSNDIDRKKERLYRLNFQDSHDFVLRDIRLVQGEDVPRCDLATASFPCTDLSLAGNRLGLKGEQSGAFHEFARILEEMGSRRPGAVLLENVIGFASSHGGRDLRDAIAALNNLGYVCDILMLDAKWFAAQSRPRLFVVAVQQSVAPDNGPAVDSIVRPAWLDRFVDAHAERLRLVTLAIPEPNADGGSSFGTVVERMSAGDRRWWDAERSRRFVASLAPLHRARLADLTSSKRLAWATAYRRTRSGAATWEIRPDDISGCLRTTRGGSSRQAVVEGGYGRSRVRWMTAREYAALQGFPDFRFEDGRENEAMFALGDAVCVPVFEWLARQCLAPLLDGKLKSLKSKRMVQPKLLDASGPYA